MTASSSSATAGSSGSGINSAPTASETAATLKRLLKRTRKHLISERDDAARLDELRRTFAALAGRGELVLRGAGVSSAGADRESDAEGAQGAENDVKRRWSAYLRSRHREFLAQLAAAVRAGRRSALRAYCGVVASTPRIEGAGKDGAVRLVDERLLRSLIEALISGSSGSNTGGSTGGGGSEVLMEEALLNLFDGEFLRPHRDVQYFALLAIRQLAGEIYSARSDTNNGGGGNASVDGQRAENLLRILLRIEIVGGDQELVNNAEAFLIAPPPLRDGGSSHDSTDEEGDDDDDEDDDDGEGSDGEGESDSDSDSSDDNDGIGQKRKRNANIHSKKNAKKSRQGRNAASSNRPTWQQATKHRRALQEAWLAVLKIPALPNRALKRALQHLPTAILPVVSAPLRFADVCTRSYEVGGVTSLLALHSLFVLMMDHGLEYPQFYASLYGLVTPRNFYAKHRTRFFRLLTNCLSKSDMLPAYVVAAFCKRLCRCALTAPPSGALFVLALVSNLLRRHGECACLVHRSQSGGGTMGDQFDPDAQDPAQARALESSLWELAALERHFHPAVAGLAKSVGTETDKAPMHDMDEFLLHTYKSLFETERKRMDPKSSKRQKAVPVTFEKPRGLFTANDVFAGILSVPEGHGVDAV